MSEHINKCFANPIIGAVMDRLLSQQEKGLAKYGHLVDVNKHDLHEWIEHLQQEMTDSLIYLEAIKQKLNG